MTSGLYPSPTPTTQGRRIVDKQKDTTRSDLEHIDVLLVPPRISRDSQMQAATDTVHQLSTMSSN